MNASLSRRRFLHMVGAVGGSTAVYRAALGLGLMPAISQASRPDLAKLKSTQQPHLVAILGAGISGLTAAYELTRRGHKVIILEASHRAGGRNLTLRGGDVIDETGNPQVCRFDDDPDLYFNAGPARIPGHHAALLSYCKELGVPLMPFINDNRNAWVQDDAMLGGKPIRNREFVTDSRGFIAELVAKSLQPEQLAAPFTRADYVHLLEYLRDFGQLDTRLTYSGSQRAGLVKHDFAMAGQLKQPLDAHELTRSGLAFLMSFSESEDQSAMMMEPVGGMDRIVTGFMKHVGKYVRTHAQVESIRLSEKHVDIAYRHKGQSLSIKADFCLNCIPMQLLAGIENNFPREYADGFAAIPRGKLFKIGLQMKERFWEREGIYGGISWTMQDIMQIWYPAHGIHGTKGIVLGAYTFNEDAGERFSRLNPQQRIELAIQQGERVHPGYRSFVENGVSIPWHRMNHMLGCAALWTDEMRALWLGRLQAPVGRHYLIGDQVSHHPGWQEGAIHSAFHALADMDKRVRSDSSYVVAA